MSTTQEDAMTGREVMKQNDGVLRSIVRSIDKNLDYTVKDVAEDEAAKFVLRLALRGREATVSLSLNDLRSADSDAIRKNALRQKIKHARDHMMDNFVRDVTGKKMARLLKQAGGIEPAIRRPMFGRGGGGGPRR
jgi:hypothetical protein